MLKMKMRQEGNQEGAEGVLGIPGLENLTPRLTRGTLTPRLDCLTALSEEEKTDFSRLIECLFPRIGGLMKPPEGGEGGQGTVTTKLVGMGSPRKVSTTRLIKAGSPKKAAIRNFSVKVQSPPKQQGDDFKSVLKSFGIRV